MRPERVADGRSWCGPAKGAVLLGEGGTRDSPGELAQAGCGRSGLSRRAQVGGDVLRRADAAHGRCGSSPRGLPRAPACRRDGGIGATGKGGTCRCCWGGGPGDVFAGEAPVLPAWAEISPRRRRAGGRSESWSGWWGHGSRTGGGRWCSAFSRPQRSPQVGRVPAAVGGGAHSLGELTGSIALVPKAPAGGELVKKLSLGSLASARFGWSMYSTPLGWACAVTGHQWPGPRLRHRPGHR